MDENPEDARQNLYEEFLSEVVKAGNPEAYFDEADLIEIYDYSSDMSNYIAKMEVLLYGARHYPDSQALATRRAWFYSSLGETEAAACLNSRVDNGGVLNRLLALYSQEPLNSAQSIEKLEEIVESTDDFADEELIQLVDFCAEAGVLDWVEKNYERIKAKCSYPQTFIYEFANTLEDDGETSRPVELFEELTMLEPFTLDFWERLAEAQYNNRSFDAAVTSSDYALALNPDSIPASRTKALALYAMHKEPEQIVALLEKVYAHPDSSETEIGVLVGLLAMSGRFNEAVAHVKNYLNVHTPTRTVLNLLITLDAAEAVPYLRELIKPNPISPFNLIEWASEEYLGANKALCGPLALVMDEIIENPGQAETAFMTEAFFVNGMYDRAAAIGNKIDFSSDKDILTRPGFIYPYVMSLVRLKEYDKASAVASAALAETERHEIPGEDTASDKMQRMSPVTAMMAEKSIVRFLRNTIAALADSKEIDPVSFSPEF